MATHKILYFADEDDVAYCTRNEQRVWRLLDDQTWELEPASFVMLSKFRNLRELTAKEEQALPAPPNP